MDDYRLVFAFEGPCPGELTRNRHGEAFHEDLSLGGTGRLY